MAEQNVAQMLVSHLADSGVKRIYGLIGDSLNPIGEAVAEDGRISWIAVRHEETAAYAAGAEAFVMDELCVCAGTAGPGSVHLINGLYEANRNHAPVLAIVTDFITSERGLGYFQATHPEQLYKDCSIFCETLASASQMPRLLQEAMQTALSYKGVAVLIVPRDVSESPVAKSVLSRQVHAIENRIKPDDNVINELADLINHHEKVTLYCGIGCKDAKDEVLYLADTLKAPTVCTLRSKDFMEINNPFNVGMNGLVSLYESKEAFDDCDLLMLLGTDFPFEKFIPQKQTTVQIDIAGKHLGRRSRLDLGVIGDMKTTLDMLLPLLKKKEDTAHLNRSLKYYQKIENKKQEELEKMAELEILRPEYLTYMLNKTAAEDCILTVDVGLNDIWAARYWEALPNRRMIGSFKHGTMAAAIPEAMGAQLAYPERQVVAMAGDGGFTMLMGELLTIVQNQLPVKIVVYNNSELGFIRLEAQMDKMKPFAIRLENPDFAKIADAAGIKGIMVDSPKNLEEILKNALLEKGPVLINAITDPNAIGY